MIAEPVADRLDAVLRTAAATTDDPLVRTWLLALLAGDEAERKADKAETLK